MFRGQLQETRIVAKLALTEDHMPMIGGAPADIFVRNWASPYNVRVVLRLRQWFSGLAPRFF
jgi:hypothetical protein